MKYHCPKCGYDQHVPRSGRFSNVTCDYCSNVFIAATEDEIRKRDDKRRLEEARQHNPHGPRMWKPLRKAINMAIVVVVALPIVLVILTFEDTSDLSPSRDTPPDRSAYHARLPNVEIVESSIRWKETLSDGSAYGEWKIHLRNNGSGVAQGNLWLHLIDEDGFVIEKIVHEILTTIPPGGEIREYEDFYIDNDDARNVRTYKTHWNQ